jgi:molecular chaperone DnaK (HSP70)
MFHICDEVLLNAKTTTRQIDALFMSGSGSLMYGIKGAATQYFGLPARTDIDPAFVVSIGAGIAMARPSLHPILRSA